MHIDERLLVLGAVPGRSARELQRAAERRELERLRPGVYVERSIWEALKPFERHVLMVHAEVSATPDAVVTHRSAAILHGYPVIGLPRLPEFQQRSSSRSTRSGHRTLRTSIDPPVPERLGDALVVPIERTLVDLASTLPLREALVPIDEHLRRGGSLGELLDLLHSTRIKAVRRAERALLLGDGDAANAAESLSRGTMHELAFPAPVVQMAVPGLDLVTDFGWPQYTLRGEMDGDQKYEDPRYTGGRTPAEVVVAEKRREARIRTATGHDFARWGWYDVLRVQPLRRELLAHGLPQLRRREPRVTIG